MTRRPVVTPRTVTVITLAISLAVSAAVIAWSFARGVEPLEPLMIAMFALCGLQSVTVAIALACGALEPGPGWGFSASAQVLKGIGWLSCVALLSISHTVRRSTPWPVALLPGILLIIGFCQEHRARVRRNSI